MPRNRSVDRGLFKRDGLWRIRWTCPYDHEHRERTGPLVFPTIPKKLSDQFTKYAKRAGLADVTFHPLRDIFISRLAPDVSATTLMTLARHRDLRTTRRYLKIEEAHLRAAVNRLDAPTNQNETGTHTGTEQMAVLELLDSIGISG